MHPLLAVVSGACQGVAKTSQLRRFFDRREMLHVMYSVAPAVSRDSPGSCRPGSAVPLRRAAIAGRRWSRGCGLRLRVVHEVLQLFAGLEEGNLLRRHFHLRAGLRIAPDAPAALPRAEASESADLDLVALLQSLNDALEDGFDNRSRIPCAATP